jgi:hypothetical protein
MAPTEVTGKVSTQLAAEIVQNTEWLIPNIYLAFVTYGRTQRKLSAMTGAVPPGIAAC